MYAKKTKNIKRFIFRDDYYYFIITHHIQYPLLNLKYKVHAVHNISRFSLNYIHNGADLLLWLRQKCVRKCTKKWSIFIFFWHRHICYVVLDTFLPPIRKGAWLCRGRCDFLGKGAWFWCIILQEKCTIFLAQFWDRK